MAINAMLVRWVGGWTEATDTSLGGTRREATLGLGAQQTEAEAVRIAREQLVIFRDHRTEVAVDPRPMGMADMPWWSYRVGDYVTAADWDGNGTDQRVLSLGASMDDNGLITFSTELNDRILGERERAEQSMKKMTNGTLRGASKVATPAGMVGKRNMPPPPKGGS
jgi:hypothetical protein